MTFRETQYYIKTTKPTAGITRLKILPTMNTIKTSAVSIKNKTKQKCLSPLSITKIITHTTSETTPSDISDIVFNWQCTDSNKRIRSLSNTTISPQRTQQRNQLSNITSTNHFSAIVAIEEDNIDAENNVELKEPSLPPPIPITPPFNYVELCKNLKQITKNRGLFMQMFYEKY